MSIQMILALWVGFGSFAQAQIHPAPRIDVPQEFRANPMWYWKETGSTCVAVPSYEIISRVAPMEIRKTKSVAKAQDCAIVLKERRLVAILSCDNQFVEKFYSKESLCSDTLGEVVQNRKK